MIPQLALAVLGLSLAAGQSDEKKWATRWTMHYSWPPPKSRSIQWMLEHGEWPDPGTSFTVGSSGMVDSVGMLRFVETNYRSGEKDHAIEMMQTYPGLDNPVLAEAVLLGKIPYDIDKVDSRVTFHIPGSYDDLLSGWEPRPDFLLLFRHMLVEVKNGNIWDEEMYEDEQANSEKIARCEEIQDQWEHDLEWYRGNYPGQMDPTNREDLKTALSMFEELVRLPDNPEMQDLLDPSFVDRSGFSHYYELRNRALEWFRRHGKEIE